MLTYVYRFPRSLRLSAPRAERAVNAVAAAVPEGFPESAPVQAVSDDVAGGTDFPWGRICFLDEEAAQRVAVVASHSMVRPQGLERLSLDLTARQRKIEIRLWAVFLDGQGREIGGMRAEEHDLRAERIESVTVALPEATREVILYIDKD